MRANHMHYEAYRDDKNDLEMIGALLASAQVASGKRPKVSNADIIHSMLEYIHSNQDSFRAHVNRGHLDDATVDRFGLNDLIVGDGGALPTPGETF